MPAKVQVVESSTTGGLPILSKTRVKGEPGTFFFSPSMIVSPLLLGAED